jgi:hypothetical protein
VNANRAATVWLATLADTKGAFQEEALRKRAEQDPPAPVGVAPKK